MAATKCPGKYVQTRGDFQFDWRGFFRVLRESDAATIEYAQGVYDNERKVLPEDRREALVILADHEAGDWVTCAAGNQCAIIPRSEDGEPKDARLRELGVNFSIKISNGLFDEAEAILDKIEQRSAKLIEKIKAKKKLITDYPSRARRVTKRKK